MSFYGLGTKPLLEKLKQLAKPREIFKRMIAVGLRDLIRHFKNLITTYTVYKRLSYHQKQNIWSSFIFDIFKINCVISLLKYLLPHTKTLTLSITLGLVIISLIKDSVILPKKTLSPYFIFVLLGASYKHKNNKNPTVKNVFLKLTIVFG